MKIKRIGYLKIMALVMIFGITTVYAAATAAGNFSLSYGQWNRSSYAKLEASYPYVKYEGQNSGSSNLRVTLSRKAYLGFGFENLEVGSTSINSNETKYVYFGKNTTGKDYLITTVNNKNNSYANAKYTFTSKSTSGSI